MLIGFDAKRAFQNTTGLGNYSRTLLHALARYHPEHQYLLLAPKVTGLFPVSDYPHVRTITPRIFPWNRLRSAWRTRGMLADLRHWQPDIYHGLSHELPRGISGIRIRTVVTMHDLIFERYPAQYPLIDRWAYRQKFQHAVRIADRVIAISRQTALDLQDFYNVPASKMRVCYQSCDERFFIRHSPERLSEFRTKWQLPSSFLLYVGTVIERKNLLGICRALQLLPASVDLPLVVVGEMKGAYADEVRRYIRGQGLERRVLFLDEMNRARGLSRIASDELPLLYQLCSLFLYPSFFEGFGIPVLEALASGVPVITSGTSSLPEAGGSGAWYTDPASEAEMATLIQQVLEDENLRVEKIRQGLEHAARFSPKASADAVIAVYKELSNR